MATFIGSHYLFIAMKDITKKLSTTLLLLATITSCSSGEIINKAAIIILGIYIGGCVIAAVGDNILGILAGIAIIVFTVFFLPNMLSEEALNIVGTICIIAIGIFAIKYFFLKS